MAPCASASIVGGITVALAPHSASTANAVNANGHLLQQGGGKAGTPQEAASASALEGGAVAAGAASTAAAGENGKEGKGRGAVRLVSLAEIQQHCTADDAWIVVDGKVYDVTVFLETHPGGHHVILNCLQGQDAGDLMRGKRKASGKEGEGGNLESEKELHSHSKAAFRMLEQFIVGRVQQERPGGSPDSRAHSDGSPLEDTGSDLGYQRKQGEGQDQGRLFQVDLSKPIVCQVGYLGDRYDAWVHDPVIGKEAPRFFESDYLEFFTQTKWWAVPLVWIPVIICMTLFSLHAGLPSQALLPTFLTGLFLWTLLEYCLHRFVFHVSTSTYWWNTFHYIIHGFHHKHPMDGSRLVFPPAFTLVILCVLWGIIRTLRIPAAVGAAGLAGSLLGYVCYDLTHYFLHFGSAFNEVSRKMKRYHLNHHFKVQSEGFGVMTWTMWDRVFGTLPTEYKAAYVAAPSTTTKSKLW